MAIAGLTEAFQAIIHLGAEATRVLDRSGAVLRDMPDDGQGRRPEVLRGDLRRILLDSLSAGTVRWGSRVAEIVPLDDGRHEVRLADRSVRAHLTAPSGEGANLAMLDGALLGQAIDAIAAFETAMFARSAKAAVEARVVIDVCLGPDAPGSLLAFFGAGPDA